MTVEDITIITTILLVITNITIQIAITTITTTQITAIMTIVEDIIIIEMIQLVITNFIIMVITGMEILFYEKEQLTRII